MNNLESYPPVLRHLSHQQQQPPCLVPDDGANPIHEPDPLPVIDLQCLNHDKNKLDKACKHWGLFRLVNHGVPLTLLSQLQNQARLVFSLSFESKQASCNSSPVTYFWGTPALTPSGTAVSRGPQNINWVEGLGVPLGQLSQFQPQLPVLESFRVPIIRKQEERSYPRPSSEHVTTSMINLNFMTNTAIHLRFELTNKLSLDVRLARLLLVDYGNHLSRIGTTLFEAMVKNLDLNLEPSRSYLSEKTGSVRVYRYPQCSNNPNVGLGMDVHTDSSVLSILNQDDEVSGLEVLKDDQWLTIKPIPNTLIVNLGDMMQVISDDRYKSVSHRVKVNKHRERISICYFVFPDEDVKIESSKYRPFTYNEFRAQVQQDIKALGHKVGLARFERNKDS